METAIELLTTGSVDELPTIAIVVELLLVGNVRVGKTVVVNKDVVNTVVIVCCIIVVGHWRRLQMQMIGAFAQSCSTHNLNSESEVFSTCLFLPCN
jgi:hypothetical protein